MTEEKRKALFLDRDGVINADTGYVHKPEDFHFLPGVFDALRQAREKGYLLVIVTNQSGIGREHYTEDDFHALNAWMLERFREAGIEIAGVYFDPTHPTQGRGKYKRISPDRKPAPGMILKAALEFDIDLAASALVGDNESDIAAGIAAGVGQIILIGPATKSMADRQVPDLEAAVLGLGGVDRSANTDR